MLRKILPRGQGEVGNLQAEVKSVSAKPEQEKLFGAYCDEWLNINKNKVKESTVDKYSSALENHIKPYFGGLLSVVITTEMTAAFVEEILHTKKLSAKTAKEFSGIY